ncbi:MAG: hypothetical protein A2Y71_15270 [Bacteroidetes bacterium RBG_13_42_15]|nr:MAG: hypothetical protein A2Y71_15270 [Bacteroidetes bacterium RBG_13_42_15]
MIMYWFSIPVGFERMGMYNYVTVINVSVIKESIAPEKSKEQNQEKVPGYINSALLQMNCFKLKTNIS